MHENETACRTHFHMKGFALRLVLKQRQTGKVTNVYLSRQAAKLQAAEAFHPGTVPVSAGFAVGSDQGHLFKSLDALRTVCNNTAHLRVPPNTGPKLWSPSLHSGAGMKQWNASPAIDKLTKTQVKLFRHRGRRSHATAYSLSRGELCWQRVSMLVWESRTKTPFLFSVANVDSPAPTLPVKEKEKEKVMPSLILTSQVPASFAKPLNQEPSTANCSNSTSHEGDVSLDKSSFEDIFH